MQKPLMVSQGSSPQMRGALVSPSLPDANDRIIPADAGSTIGCIRISPQRGDHPRRCGEHFTLTFEWKGDRGSSPQMRGALRNLISSMGSNRIIPADAGSTSLQEEVPFRTGDHPRRCGEHRQPRADQHG